MPAPRLTASYSAPRLTARCSAHGRLLPECDACASTLVMSRWTSALSGYALADALETLARNYRYYTPAEQRAVLIEAARRVRPLNPALNTEQEKRSCSHPSPARAAGTCAGPCAASRPSAAPGTRHGWRRAVCPLRL